jgi:hypothetical protein
MQYLIIEDSNANLPVASCQVSPFAKFRESVAPYSGLIIAR